MDLGTAFYLDPVNVIFVHAVELWTGQLMPTL